MINDPQVCCGNPAACNHVCFHKDEWEKRFHEEFRRREEVNQKFDNVNHPSHYALLPGVEVIDVRDALFAKMPVDVPHDVADCWSRSWEYLTRMWGKNGLEDAKKARFYLDRMIEKMERTE